jgi:cold shock CspA family protein
LRLNTDPVAQDTPLHVEANTLYEVTEDQLPGYVQVGDVSCVITGTSQAVTHPVTLDEGQSVTCTITNDDQAPELIVTKSVINDDGGNAVAADFQLRVNGTAVAQDTPVAGILANTAYTVTEDQLAGYVQAGDVSCVITDTSQAVAHPVTLNEGQSVTCTITNDDLAPGLTVVKNVINDDGGDAQPSDFQLYVNLEPQDQGVPLDVDANVEYTVTEDQLSGYTLVGVACVDSGGDPVDHPVTLAEGQAVLCTVTNDDIAPELIVTKSVVNDAGGNAVAADFQLRLNGDPVDQDLVLDVDSNTVYTVTEDQLPGYVQVGEVSCVITGTQQAVAHPVVLSEGQSVTCTITNDDVAPGLTVVKNVINDDGGNAVAGDFQLYVDGEPADQGVALDVEANVAHTVTEDQLPGYTQVGQVSCIDNEAQQAVAHPVTLSEGQSVTCTITNNDDAPELILVKNVINDDDGEAVAGDFQLRLNGALANQGVVLSVDANTEYTVTEDQVTGYEQIGGVACVDNDTGQVVAHPVTLAEGQSVTCTITNNDVGVLGIDVLPLTGLDSDILFALSASMALLGLLAVLASRQWRREEESDR